MAFQAQISSLGDEVQVANDVFSYTWRGQGNNCNSYLLRYRVDGATCYALIDPGHLTVPVPISNGRAIVSVMQEAGLDSLLSSLKADGISPQDVRLVINTHAHGDHCEASLWWKDQQGAVVALHETERGAYAKAVPGNQRRPSAGAHDPEPDLFLDEGELRLGKPESHRLRVFHTPGHSPGGISIYWPERKVLIVGDLVFYRSVGRTDLPGGSPEKMREAIRRLAELDVEHLLTGHPYGHSGIISGKAAVEENFSFVLSYILR